MLSKGWPWVEEGAWTAEEDRILIKYIQYNGEGSWRALPENAGAYPQITHRSHFPFDGYFILQVSYVGMLNYCSCILYLIMCVTPLKGF